VEFDALRCCSLFYGMDDELLCQVIPSVKETALTPAQRLFSQGDSGDGFYVVRLGAVRLQKRMGDHDILPLADLGAGDVFGELSLINDAPRAAECVSIDETKLWYLSRDCFEQLRPTAPQAYLAMLENLTGVLCRRLNGANVQVAAILKELDSVVGERDGLEECAEKGRSRLVRFLTTLGVGEAKPRA